MIKEEWKEITMDIGADIIVFDMDLLDTSFQVEFQYRILKN
ncbi:MULTISPECIES: hypothetical protein [unclassified Halanaerobium]|nr:MULTISPECIES: hypothetical protein [unclassified Halanaerobium]RCW50725.1 hypothetical protein DFR78_10285 [Halanaerobium sp. MA284_MarDTE_T2]RCW78564.1 hypothetical protein DER71_1516 [Halanaerobium sp. DL-01]